MIKLKKTIILAIVLVFMIPQFSYADTLLNEFSKAAILIDQDTNRVLYEKQADEKRPIASLTKMMTFLIAIESIQNNKVSENDIVVIDKQSAAQTGSTCKLNEGDKKELKELMKGLMLVSGNDAAMAIAKYIGGSQEEFVNMMNEKAKQIGMNDTCYLNPNGLPIYHDPEHKNPPEENHSTARDIAKLGKYMFDHHPKEVAEITSTRIYEDKEKKLLHNNTNPLLTEVAGVDGIKTGYTDNAGYCLAFSMLQNKDQRNDKKHRLIGVVLGNVNQNDRKIGAESILKYGINDYSAKIVATKGQVLGKAKVDTIKGLELEVKAKDDIYLMLKNNENYTSKIEIQTDKVKYPIKSGQDIGVVKYFDESGKVLQTSQVINNTDSKDISFTLKVKILYKHICDFFKK